MVTLKRVKVLKERNVGGEYLIREQALNGELYACIPLKIECTPYVMLLGFKNQTELSSNHSLSLN